MANIKDVAKKAGVSVATVSRALNGDKAVRPETVKKVQLAAESLSYQPNVLGRNLRRLRTNTVLLLIPTASNQFYSKILAGAEETLRAAGVRTVFGVTYGERAPEADFHNMLCQHRVDGLILLQSAYTGPELAARLSGLPVVYCCEYPENAPFSTVGIDNRRAAEEATNALLARGCKTVGMIGFSDYYASGEARLSGYQAAMAAAGLPPLSVRTPAGQHSFEGGMEAYRRFVSRYGVPDGLFCASDLLAAGVQKQAAAENAAPLVIGFDDTAITRMLTPTLSSVAQPRLALGQKAAALLLERLKNPAAAEKHLILSHTLIFRESCPPI